MRNLILILILASMAIFAFGNANYRAYFYIGEHQYNSSDSCGRLKMFFGWCDTTADCEDAFMWYGIPQKGQYDANCHCGVYQHSDTLWECNEFMDGSTTYKFSIKENGDLILNIIESKFFYEDLKAGDTVTLHPIPRTEENYVKMFDE